MSLTVGLSIVSQALEGEVLYSSAPILLIVAGFEYQLRYIPVRFAFLSASRI